MKFSVNRSNLIRSAAVFFFCILISACGAHKTLESLMSTESASIGLTFLMKTFKRSRKRLKMRKTGLIL